MKGNNKVTISGVTLTVKPISIKLLEAFDRYHVPPKPPTREVELVGGVTESVADESDPEYQAQLKAHLARTTDDFLGMLVEFGLDFQMPEDNGWKTMLRRAGIVLNSEESDKLAYVQYILMSDFMSDLKILSMAVMRASGIDEETIANMADLF